MLYEYNYISLLDQSMSHSEHDRGIVHESVYGSSKLTVVGGSPRDVMEPIKGWQELYKFSNDFGLIISHLWYPEDCLFRYISSEAWLAMEFRLGGNFLGPNRGMGGPFCVVSSKPAGMENESTLESEKWYDAVSIVIRAEAIEKVLSVPLEELPVTSQEFLRSNAFLKQRIDLLKCADIMDAVLGIRHCSLKGVLRILSMRGKVLDIVSLVLSQIGDASDQQPHSRLALSKRDKTALNKARQLIEDDLSVRRSIGELTQRCGINKNKLNSGFRALFGQTVHQYTAELRMVRAFELLSSDCASVTEAALAVGFEDASSLRAPFHQRFGFGPAELVKKTRVDSL